MPATFDKLREQAERILKAGLTAVQPERLIRDRLTLEGDVLQVQGRKFDLSRYRRCLVIGFGKASATMAAALEALLGDRIAGGVVITKYGHGAPCQRIAVREAGHPVPDDAGLQATEELLNTVANLDPEDLIICLISGGGSALLEAPAPGISLEDVQRVTDLLLRCGAAIEEVNTVRKHLSRVKGGQLLRHLHPAACLALILSDVIGNPPESIASGPTAPDPTTYAEALAVLQRYGVMDETPAAVRAHLQAGAAGAAPETVKPGDPVLCQVQNFILGDNLLALQAAAKAARREGYSPVILTSRMQGEAREAARVIAGIVQEVLSSGHPVEPPACLLFGGETTVTVRGTGRGGRNQEFALAALMALKNEARPYLLLSCGTDGTDGPTDAAGGLAAPEIRRRAVQNGLSPEAFLANNDAYTFLKAVDALLTTGPTGTNVMDMGLALVPDPLSSS